MINYYYKIMKLGEVKNKYIVITFNMPSNLSSDYIRGVYEDISDNVMSIRRAVFNYLENI